MVRGGSWTNDTYNLRASRRNSYTPDIAYYVIIGFRVARAPF